MRSPNSDLCAKCVFLLWPAGGHSMAARVPPAGSPPAASRRPGRRGPLRRSSVAAPGSAFPRCSGRSGTSAGAPRSSRLPGVGRLTWPKASLGRPRPRTPAVLQLSPELAPVRSLRCPYSNHPRSVQLPRETHCLIEAAELFARTALPLPALSSKAQLRSHARLS